MTTKTVMKSGFTVVKDGDSFKYVFVTSDGERIDCTPGSKIPNGFNAISSWLHAQITFIDELSLACEDKECGSFFYEGILYSFAYDINYVIDGWVHFFDLPIEVRKAHVWLGGIFMDLRND